MLCPSVPLVAAAPQQDGTARGGLPVCPTAVLHHPARYRIICATGRASCRWGWSGWSLLVHLRGKGERTEVRPVSKVAGSPHRLGRLLDFGVFSFRCGEPQVPSAGVSTARGTRIS